MHPIQYTYMHYALHIYVHHFDIYLATIQNPYVNTYTGKKRQN